jgi:hypothetical protein
MCLSIMSKKYKKGYICVDCCNNSCKIKKKRMRKMYNRNKVYTIESINDKFKNL